MIVIWSLIGAGCGTRYHLYQIVEQYWSVSNLSLLDIFQQLFSGLFFVYHQNSSQMTLVIVMAIYSHVDGLVRVVSSFRSVSILLSRMIVYEWRIDDCLWIVLFILGVQFCRLGICLSNQGLELLFEA